MSSAFARSFAATIWKISTASAVLLAALLPAPAGAASSAVVLTYHHVAEDTPPSTSVTPETFRRHVDHLADSGFHVWPLPKLVATLRAGEEVPERTVALTFDDGYRSVYETAFPLLRRRGWPFTVFVTTEYVDGGDDNFATWDQLREMEAAGATIANHSVSHPHMIRRRQGESESAWRQRMRGEITRAQARLEQEVKDPPLLFAYPFGEFSPAVAAMVTDLGYVGFGQQSGAFGPGSDFAALPRFPVATGFASMETFKLKVRSRPLPVKHTRPESGVLGPDDARPTLRIALAAGPYRPDSVRCYLRGESVPLEFEGGDPPVLKVRPSTPIGAGRTKVNCTAPVQGSDDWFWYSFLWMKPLADGSWYRE